MPQVGSAAPYGQFGAGDYPSKTIPNNIAFQYPGTRNFRSALGMFGDLAYGPYAGGIGAVGSAQAMDPLAQTEQGAMQGGGGTFSQPGLGANTVGQLFGGAMQNEAQKQRAQQEQTMQALQGIGNVGKALADSIYSQESAANQLMSAENAAESAKIAGALDLTTTAIDLYMAGTNPTSAAASTANATGTASQGAQAGQGAGGQAQSAAGGGAPGTSPFGEIQNWWGNTAWPTLQGMFQRPPTVQPINPVTPGYGTGNMPAYGPSAPFVTP